MELGEPARKVVNVMKRSDRDDSVEAPRIGELLERDGLKDRARGCGGIDRDDLVTQLVQLSCEPAIAAPDLEHPRGPRRQLGCHKVQHPVLNHQPDVLTRMGDADVDTLERRYAALNRGDLASGVQVETRLAYVWTIADGKAVRWEGVPEPETVLSDVG